MRAIQQVAGCKRIWHTAILPASAWGGEVTGFSDTELAELRVRAKKLFGHPHISSDVFEAAVPARSPLGKATVLCVERYAEEWWRASDVRQANGKVLSMKELRAAYEAARASFEGGLGEAGPVGAMLRSLCWAGWRSTNATSFESPSAGAISILETSPKQVARLYQRDVLACIERRADESIRRREGLGDDFEGLWWEAVQACLSGSFFTALERHVVVSLLGGTYMTGERAQAWGYLVSGQCGVCAVPDTVRHRVTCCPRFEAGRSADDSGWQEGMEACRAIGDPLLQDLFLPSRPQPSKVKNTTDWY